MKQRTITKAELARQLGVSRAYITMIANGKRKPSQDIVNKLSNLDVNKQLQISNPKSCSSANSDTSPYLKLSKLLIRCQQPRKELLTKFLASRR